ncbi:DegT/DnrJ/EryC1/StrS family aminotransferase [Endothiovibrio diazotrophicus]
MNSTERRLARMHGKSEARLVGSGTVGLVAALRVLGLEGRRVGVPNNVCFSVPQAVLYAGAEPVYLDVEAQRFGLSPECCAEQQGLAALVAVHAYGRLCEIEALARLCRERGWYLIEDFAVAQGAGGEAPAGAYGDISVTSFGAGKIIDIGRGGAVFTDEPEWAAGMAAFAAACPPFSAADERAEEEVNRLHNSTYNNQFLFHRAPDGERFRRVLEGHRDAYLFGWEEARRDLLERALDDLPANLARRRAKACRLIEGLAGVAGVRAVEHSPGDTYWRLNVMVERGRDALFRHLLDQRYPISSWQPSVDRFLEPAGRWAETPVSDRVGDTILNLWVNDQVDEAYMTRIIDEIRRFLDDRTP